MKFKKELKAMIHDGGSVNMKNKERSPKEFDEANLIYDCDWEIGEKIEKEHGFYWLTGYHKETGAKYEATGHVYAGEIVEINTPIMVVD